MNDFEASRKVMVLDDNVLDVLKVEKVLKAANYEVSTLLSPAGALAKIEFELPDVLLVELSTKNLNIDALMNELRAGSLLNEMAIVAFSGLDPEFLQSWCIQHDVNGYYSKSMGIENVDTFLNNFFE